MKLHQNRDVSLPSLIFESLVFWLSCPWIAYLITLSFSKNFRLLSYKKKLLITLICLPVMLVVAAIQINSGGDSGALEFPVLISLVCFSIAGRCWSSGSNDRGSSAYESLAFYLLVIYLSISIIVFVSMSWMGRH